MKKKLILLMTVWLIGCLMMLGRTFYVEKAIGVKSSKRTVTAGQNLDENTHIIIDEGGKLMFVDRQSKNRWLVQKKFKGKIGKLAKKKKHGLVEQSIAYLKSLFVEGDTERQSYGVVMKGHDNALDSTYAVDRSIHMSQDSISFFDVR